MSRNEIEEKDQRVVKKIREIVAGKEAQPARGQGRNKARGLWLPALVVGLIVLGLVAFRQPSRTTRPQVPDTPAGQTAADVDAAEQGGDAGQTGPPAVTHAPDTGLPAEGEILPGTAAIEKTTDGQRSMQPAPAETEPPDARETTVDTGTAAVPETPAAAPATRAAAPASGVQISHLVACGAVRDKQFVSARSTFSLSEDPVAMVWMRVLSDHPPLTLTHVYSVNGRHYCDVPLTINYPHMRTWSQVTINRDHHIGRWHVDVVDENGRILDQIDFSVVP